MQQGKPYEDKFILMNTWDVGLPLVYRDENGNIIKHWKDGRKEILKPKEEEEGLFLNEENEGAYADDLID